MPAPVLEQIAEKILARVKAGTYTAPYKLKKCVRPNRQHTNADPEHLNALVQQSGGTVADAGNSDEGNVDIVSFVQPFEISVLVRPSELTDEPIDTVINYLIADLIKAITTPVSGDWAQWDGLALLSTYVPSTVHSGDGSLSAAVVTLNITYRHSADDPYQVR